MGQKLQYFQFCQISNENKHAFEGLYVLNDDTLSGGRSFKLNIEESTIVLLLPVVGAVGYKATNGSEGIVNAGALQIIYLENNSALELYNPYENDLVNFLQLWIKAPVSKNNSIDKPFGFDLEEDKDQLISISRNSVYPTVRIGKFAGRKEAVYKMFRPQNSVFVFVVQGAFEVQGRLLHARDGLGLWDDTNDIELEALSNDAIVLLVELDLTW